MIDHNNILIDILNNKAILAPLIAWFITQTIKVVIATIKEKKFDFSLYLIPGGFPSSHSASVTALSCGGGIFRRGFLCFLLLLWPLQLLFYTMLQF